MDYLGRTLIAMENERQREVATLAGGCFWCLDAVYRQLRGVESVVSGYTGGHLVNPTYKQVCSGSTGHAEAVQITFDPNVITFGDLLDVFFTIHDPTTLNRQGADYGTQYRSAIFFHSPEQREIAEQKIRDVQAAEIWSDPIVTEVVPLETYYVAEDYHQDYFSWNPAQMYCQFTVAPKVAKVRKAFQDKLRASS